jgi:hypothetical protein
MYSNQIEYVMKNIKIRLQRHTNDSILIQRKLFEKGVRWLSGQEINEYLKCTFLYVDENQILKIGSDVEKFNDSSYQEITVDDLGIPRSLIKNKYQKYQLS